MSLILEDAPRHQASNLDYDTVPLPRERIPSGIRERPSGAGDGGFIAGRKLFVNGRTVYPGEFLLPSIRAEARRW